MLESKAPQNDKEEPMTITIENASKELYTAIKSLAKIDNAKCKVQKPKLTKFEKEILKAKAELEKEKREGTLKTYANMAEFRAAIENGEI